MNKRLYVLICSVATTIILMVSCSAKKEQIIRRVISLNGLNIRLHPSVKSRIVSVLQFNDEIEVIETSTKESVIHGKKGYWVKVKKGNYTGWVFSPFLRDRNSTPTYILSQRIKLAKLLGRNHEDRISEQLFRIKKKYGEGNYFRVVALTEKIFLRNDSSVARRTNRNLYLRTDNRWILKKDSTSKGIDYFGYFYQGLFPDAKLYLLIKGFYEGKSVLLINQSTGTELTNTMPKKFHVIDTPSISPDRKHILLIGIDGLYSGLSNNQCITILKSTKNRWDRVFTTQIQDVDPTIKVIPVWLENDAVRLARISIHDNSTNIHTLNHLIVFENKKWVLKDIH